MAGTLGRLLGIAAFLLVAAQMEAKPRILPGKSGVFATAPVLEDIEDQQEKMARRREVKVDEHSEVVSQHDAPASRREAPLSSVDENGRYIGAFDPECSDTLTISPIHKSVELEPDSRILKHGATTCHWNIVGTEDCIPVVSCHKFALLEAGDDKDDPCEEEYLEITDGTNGYKKFCGREGPEEITSGRRDRDFYITLMLANEGRVNERHLKCTVSCNPGKIAGIALEENSEPEVDDECYCGRKPNSELVVGGEESEKGEFPWMVALVATGTRKPYCSGSIINNKFILTAAHCFKGPYTRAENINVLLNAHSMDLTTGAGADGEPGQPSIIYTPEQLEALDERDNSHRFTVERYYIHPLYARLTNDYDVALLKLDKPIDFRTIKEVGPVCIPKNHAWDESKEGAKAVVSGYGLNDSEAVTSMATLQKLDLAVFTEDECKEFYDTRFTRRMLCAGFKEGGRDSCKGDSGGPLVSLKTQQVWEQIGIVSFGEGCAAANRPGVYINTHQVAQWIRYISNMEDARWCAGN